MIVEETVTPAIGIDLAIDKHFASPACSPGGSGSYLVTVTNVGDTNAGGPFTVTDTLPPGVTFVSVSGSGWQCSGVTQVTCTFNGNLNGGASISFTLQVNVGLAAGPILTNEVDVAAVTGELNTGNNHATEVTICTGGTTGVPAMDLRGFVVALLAMVGIAYLRLRSSNPSS